ncbi:hypothetical protein C364_05824 [Cryptococcus neoformans Bt63]|nr:hypothetical protein C364_05824 [Cryptococcus neoformans var. grubii Bt63]
MSKLVSESDLLQALKALGDSNEFVAQGEEVLHSSSNHYPEGATTELSKNGVAYIHDSIVIVHPPVSDNSDTPIQVNLGTQNLETSTLQHISPIHISEPLQESVLAGIHNDVPHRQEEVSNLPPPMVCSASFSTTTATTTDLVNTARPQQWGVNPFASHPNFFSVDSSFPYPLSLEQQQQRPFQLVFHPIQPLQLPGSTNTRDPPASDPHNRHQPQRPFELDHPWQPSQPLVTDVRSYPAQFPSLSTSGQLVKQQEPSSTSTHGRFATTTGIPDRSTDFMDTLDSKHQYPSHPVNPRLMAFPTTNDVSPPYQSGSDLQQDVKSNQPSARPNDTPGFNWAKNRVSSDVTKPSSSRYILFGALGSPGSHVMPQTERETREEPQRRQHACNCCRAAKNKCIGGGRQTNESCRRCIRKGKICDWTAKPRKYGRQRTPPSWGDP